MNELHMKVHFNDHVFILDATGLENGSSGGGQERWFVRLPPVLFLELSRFQYNMEKKTAEKIHNRLDFPEQIFMDRYVVENKVVVRQKREEVRALKERRATLKSKLDKFTSYGESKLELPLILQKTLEFANAATSKVMQPPTVASVGKLLSQIKDVFQKTQIYICSFFSGL